MSKFTYKIKQTVIPFIKICILSMLFFDIVYFMLFVLHPPSYREGDTNFLIPICYGLIIQLLVLRRFINKFNLPSNAFMVNMISYILLCAQILVSLPLVRQIGNFVTEVDNAYEITATSNHRSFAIKDFDIDKTKIGETLWISRESRKYGGPYSRLNLVLAAPVITNDRNDKKRLTYWYCREYSWNMKTTKVDRSDIDSFWDTSIANFTSSNTINKVVYFEKLPYKWINDYQLTAIDDITKDKQASELVVLEPQFRSHTTRILWQIVFLLIAIMVSILMWGLNMFKAEPKNNNWLIKKNKKKLNDIQ